MAAGAEPYLDAERAVDSFVDEAALEEVRVGLTQVVELQCNLRVDANASRVRRDAWLACKVRGRAASYLK